MIVVIVEGTQQEINEYLRLKAMLNVPVKMDRRDKRREYARNYRRIRKQMKES